MHLRRRIKSEGGSFLLEALVGSTITLGGLLGLGLMLTQAMTTTTSTKWREQGVAVQRELIEAARSIPYEELVPNAVVPAVQGRNGSGLADGSVTAGWTIQRRDAQYTVTLGVCSVDDPSDGIGAHDPATFCATGPGTTSPAACRSVLAATTADERTAAAAAAGVTVGDCGVDSDLDGEVDGLVEAEAGACLLDACPAPSTTDATPDDYKRIITLVRWDRGHGSRYALQSTIVPNPGLSTAPRVSDLTTPAPDPVTGDTSIAFQVTTDRTAQAVSWSVDGTRLGTATGTGTSWSFTWQLGAVGSDAPQSDEVLDGSYVVGARAFDDQGSPGPHRGKTVRINRRAPYAPARFAAGRNGAGVDFEWSASPERDVEGYRVYRVDGAGTVQVCALTPATSCRDSNPPDLPSVDYRVVAVDRDASGGLREGAASPTMSVSQANNAPWPPSNLTLVAAGGDTVLSWAASPGDPDAGDAIDHYRIYRDGELVDDRFDRTSTAQELSYTDSRTNGVQHTYWVVAVDGNLAESTKLGPVTG